MRLSAGVSALVAGGLALLAQAPGIAGDLIWDDVLLLRRTDLYTDASRLGEALTTPLGRETFYWRPLATTSFLLETLVHGGSAAGHRATAALLFAATAGVATLVLARLLRSAGAGLLAGLVFALHPLHVETATWVSARFDLLLGMFTFLALAARSSLGVALATVAACLSKEAAVVLPLSVPLFAAASDDPPPGTARRALASQRRLALATVTGVAVAAFLRYEVLGWVLRTRAASVEDAGGPFSRLLLVGRAAATAFETLVFPWGTVGPAHPGPRPVPAGDLRAWIGLALLAAAVAGTAWALRRRPKTGFLGAAFLVSLLPASQIVPLDLAGDMDAADRFLFVPAFFATALVADLAVAFVARNPAASRRVAGTAAVLAAAFAAGRLAILPRWHDSVRFWGWASERAPESWLFRAQHAIACLEVGDLDGAEAAARAAQVQAPDILAQVLRARGRTAEALSVLDGALRLRSRAGPPRLLRAEIRLETGDAEGALQDFEFLVRDPDAAGAGRFEPLTAAALAGSAQALATLPGRKADAELRLSQAVAAVAGDDARGWAAISRAYGALGRPDDARRAADRAEGRPPDGR